MVCFRLTFGRKWGVQFEKRPRLKVPCNEAQAGIHALRQGGRRRYSGVEATAEELSSQDRNLIGCRGQMADASWDCLNQVAHALSARCVDLSEDAA